MPKSRTRKKAKSKQSAKIDWGASSAKGSDKINLLLGAILVVALAGGGLFWWQASQTRSRFMYLVDDGQPALARVQTMPNHGGGHLSPGQGHSYGVPFPTSGIHARTPTEPGFYSESQPPIGLVHALEHGHVVIYYGQPGGDALTLLKDWTSLYAGHWDGVIAVPSPGLGNSVVLTAWRKMLRLDRFAPAASAAFIDAYRGRGPENPVR
ncbi:MAG: DUF3105 domain-containing protein [Kiloniellales bacterium]